MHTRTPCRQGVRKAHGRESLLAILHFKHELVGDIQVSVKVQSCGFVVQTGTGVATIEHLQGHDHVYRQPFGQGYGYGPDAIAHDDFLNHRRFRGIVIVLLFHHIQDICLLCFG